jgi:ABC-type phosphate/phosphonate transport system permease subunit
MPKDDTECEVCSTLLMALAGTFVAGFFSVVPVCTAE